MCAKWHTWLRDRAALRFVRFYILIFIIAVFAGQKLSACQQFVAKSGPMMKTENIVVFNATHIVSRLQESERFVGELYQPAKLHSIRAYAGSEHAGGAFWQEMFQKLFDVGFCSFSLDNAPGVGLG